LSRGLLCGFWRGNRKEHVVVQSSAAEKSLKLGVGILALGGAVLLLYYGRVFFITVTIAAMIAFLLDPAVVFFMKLRMPRGLASFVVCSISLMLLYFAGVGVYLQGAAMLEDLPAYGQRINEITDSAAARMQNFEDSVYRSLIPKRLQQARPEPVIAPEPPPSSKNRKNAPQVPAAPPAVQEVRIQQEPTSLFNYVYSYLRQFYDVLLMASFVPFLVYFLLSWRDHLRSRYLLLFDDERRETAREAWGGIGDMVRAYVIGNFMLGLFLTVASSLLFAAVRLPYWMLVAPISGFASLIPYIGLPLALAPPLVAALPVSKEPAIYLFLTGSVAILHLLGLNLLYPKFVGARVHLNPLVVTVALMFWGMLWGGIGLVLAIPLTASIKAVCDHVSSLKPYGRLLGD
jgi:predicted PurR-regulated permease PerM